MQEPWCCQSQSGLTCISAQIWGETASTCGRGSSNLVAVSLIMPRMVSVIIYSTSKQLSSHTDLWIEGAGLCDLIQSHIQLGAVDTLIKAQGSSLT